MISELCRTTDHLGRYGGEEFLIVIPETDIEGATIFAERVRSAVARTPLDRIEEGITISIGVAEWRDGDGSARKLVSEADRALLQAKSESSDETVRSPLSTPIKYPSPSGPRCLRTVVILRRSSASTPLSSKWKIPAIPHITNLLFKTLNEIEPTCKR